MVIAQEYRNIAILEEVETVETVEIVETVKYVAENDIKYRLDLLENMLIELKQKIQIYNQ